MQPDIERIKNELNELYQAALGKPAGFEFLARTSEYIEFIETTPILFEIMQNEKKKNDEFLAPFMDKKGNVPKATRDKIWSVVMQQSIWQQYFVFHLEIYRALSQKVNKDPKKVLERIKKRFSSFLTFKRAFWPFTKDSRVALGTTFVYKLIMKDFHKRLLRLLEEWAIRQASGGLETEMNISGLTLSSSFEELNSILHIGHWKIKIARQKKLSKAHDILKYIFIDNADNLTGDFYYSEIAQDVFGDSEYAKRENAWTPYTTAFNDIQNKVIKETKGKIINYLDISGGITGRVKINPKYLMKPKEK